MLSDGWHHIRIDVEEGSLSADQPLILEYRLTGIAGAQAKLLPLRRLLQLCRTGRFAHGPASHDRRVGRWIQVLRVHDALRASATQREIAAVLFGEARTAADWRGASDSLRSRVQRLVREARAMRRGGYRTLLAGRDGGGGPEVGNDRSSPGGRAGSPKGHHRS